MTNEQFRNLLNYAVKTNKLSINEALKLAEDRKAEQENNYARPRTFARVTKRLIWK